MTYQKRNSCIAFLGILLLTVFFAPPAHADEAAAASFASHSLVLSATENIDYWLFEPKNATADAAYRVSARWQRQRRRYQ